MEGGRSRVNQRGIGNVGGTDDDGLVRQRYGRR